MLIQSQARFRAIDGLALILFSAGMVLAGCGDDPPSDDPYPVDRETFERVATELERRSFRQFHPSVDASPRRGVVIDFHDGFRMWAQYAQDGHAVYEWELTAADYHIEWTGDVAEIVLFPAGAMSVQQFPENCSGCIPTSDVSISVRNVFDSDEIAFRINDPNNVLPLPFPVFSSWTHFDEDEYIIEPYTQGAY